MGWSGRRDLNPRPLHPQCSALPDCATPRSRAVYHRCPAPIPVILCEVAGSRRLTRHPARSRGISSVWREILRQNGRSAILDGAKRRPSGRGARMPRVTTLRFAQNDGGTARCESPSGGAKCGGRASHGWRARSVHGCIYSVRRTSHRQTATGRSYSRSMTCWSSRARVLSSAALAGGLLASSLSLRRAPSMVKPFS